MGCWPTSYLQTTVRTGTLASVADQIKRIKASLLQRGDIIIEAERPLARIVHRKAEKDVVVWRDQDTEDPWDVIPQGDEVTIYRPVAATCPDGGYCHHNCQGRDCFRVRTCGPLSDVYVGDEWPDALRASMERNVWDPRQASEWGSCVRCGRDDEHGEFVELMTAQRTPSNPDGGTGDSICPECIKRDEEDRGVGYVERS